MNYYIEQKFVNSQPIEMYYVRRHSLMPIPPRLEFAFPSFKEAKEYCDLLNHPPKTEYKKVYP